MRIVLNRVYDPRTNCWVGESPIPDEVMQHILIPSPGYERPSLLALLHVLCVRDKIKEIGK